MALLIFMDQEQNEIIRFTGDYVPPIGHGVSFESEGIYRVTHVVTSYRLAEIVAHQIVVEPIIQRSETELWLRDIVLNERSK